MRLFTAFTLLSLLTLCNANSFYGDEELARAFECALLDSHTKIMNYIKEKNLPFSPLQDCFMNPNYYHYPKQSVMGGLFDVLVKGVVKVGVMIDDPYLDFFHYILNTTFTRIGEKYLYDTPQIAFQDYTDTDKLFNDLRAGIIDGISFSFFLSFSLTFFFFLLSFFFFPPFPLYFPFSISFSIALSLSSSLSSSIPHRVQCAAPVWAAGARGGRRVCAAAVGRSAETSASPQRRGRSTRFQTSKEKMCDRIA